MSIHSEQPSLLLLLLLRGFIERRIAQRPQLLLPMQMYTGNSRWISVHRAHRVQPYAKQCNGGS